LLSSNKTLDKRQIAPEALGKLRKTILDLFASSAFETVGIRDICTRARVSPQTVYKYFGNKEAMLYACIRSDLDELNRLCLNATANIQSLKDQMHAFISAWCDFYFSRPNIARIVFLNIPMRYWVGERDIIQAPVHRATENFLKQGQDNGEIWPDLDIHIVKNMIMGSAHRVMIYWLDTGGVTKQEACEELNKAMTRLIFIR